MGSAGVRNLARNTAMLATAQTIGTAARLVYVVFVARLLGPEVYALLAYVQSWHLAFLPIALAGLGPALVHWVAADRARTAELAAAALALRLAATLAAAGACLALALALAPDRRAPGLIAVLLLALAGRAVTAWAQHLFVVCDLNRYTLRQEATFRVLELGAALLVLFAGGGLSALVLVHALCWCLQALLALRVVAARVGPVRLAWPRCAIRDLGAFAVPFFLLQLLAEWRIHGPLILYRGVTDDTVLFGQFALAMQVMLLVCAVPQALGAAVQPLLSRSAVRQDGRDLAYAATLQRLAFVGGALAGLLGLALGPALFTWLFGPAFATAGRLAGMTLWCLIPLTAGFGFPLVLMLRGEARGQIAQSMAATLVMAALVPGLGSAFGAPGAILGAGLGFATPPLLSTALALRRAPGTGQNVLLRPALSAAAPLAIYLTLEPASVVLALAIALIAMAVLVGRLGVVSRADLALLRGLPAGVAPVKPAPLP